MPDCVIYDAKLNGCWAGQCSIYGDWTCCQECKRLQRCPVPCVDIRQERQTALQTVRRNRKNHYWIQLMSAAVIIALLVLTLVSCGANYAQPKKELVVVTHVVTSGQDLWSIAAKYITPDRDIREFIEGIYELNYEQVFMEREQQGVNRKMVFPGDRLEIRYWKSIK